jgi:hypothetical protein
MPHLTLPVSPGGLLIDIHVGVSRSREEALNESSQSIPPKVAARALIDTGADCSCMDMEIIKRLGLTPSGSTTILTPSTGANPVCVNQYDVSIHISFPHASMSYGWANVGLIEADLASQGIQALIGRDILGNGLLIYDGQSGTFTLSF